MIAVKVKTLLFKHTLELRSYEKISPALHSFSTKKLLPFGVCEHLTKPVRDYYSYLLVILPS